MKKNLVKLSMIAGSAFSLALCFDLLFYRKAPGISFPLFMALLLSTSYFLARRSEIELRPELHALAFASFALSMMVSIRASVLLISLDIAVSLNLFVLLLGAFAGGSLRRFLLVDYLAEPIRIARALVDRVVSNGPRTFLRSRGTGRKQRVSAGEFRGKRSPCRFLWSSASCYPRPISSFAST